LNKIIQLYKTPSLSLGVKWWVKRLRKGLLGNFVPKKKKRKKRKKEIKKSQHKNIVFFIVNKSKLQHPT